MSTETKQFYRRLSQLLCEISDDSYSNTSAWVKPQISFSLLQTSISCPRGSRSKKYNIPTEERMDIDVANSGVNINHQLISLNMFICLHLPVFVCICIYMYMNV